ncbi:MULTISPECIES: DUF4145 domain-containing protein [unclassified Variovorax]|uniref:DUF4145 domain-containing protein n=1 Tax=unclassified Variovorax TaxID=663243 RepID=UPI003F4598C6
MISDQFEKRFSELDRSFAQIPIRRASNGYESSEQGGWKGWASSAQNLIKAVFSENSPHYQNFSKQSAQTNDRYGDASELRGLYQIFSSAKEDFDGGYVFNVELRVSGEIFGDFVGLAKTALAEGKKDVAAVLACAALEDALKRYAQANGLNVDGKTMQDVVGALKGAGYVSGAQKSLLDTMPRIRNMALHADWEKLTEPDVSSVIGFVEQFLLTKFS